VGGQTASHRIDISPELILRKAHENIATQFYTLRSCREDGEDEQKCGLSEEAGHAHGCVPALS
jgi:hypothetical protein